MKALSLKQPWAEIVVAGHKDVENRSWQSSYRGPLVIHASIKPDAPAMRWAMQNGYVKAADCDYGAAIGVVDLHHIFAPDDPKCCSDWAQPGYFHWLVGNARRFPEPIPMRGCLGLFGVPEPLEAVIQMAIEQAVEDCP